MASQAYKTSSNEEYIIIGNDALMKCLIPSFVADFVSVVNWEDSEGSMIYANNNLGNDRMGHTQVFLIHEKTQPTVNLGFVFIKKVNMSKLALDWCYAPILASQYILSLWTNRNDSFLK